MARTTPLVSIIVVTHNSAQWIEDCLRALLGQEYSGSSEILVVDSGSTDDTLRIVREAFADDVRIVSLENHGFGAACNEGAKAARGRILAFANPDTVPEANWLAPLVETIERANVIATSKILLMEFPDRLNTIGHVPHLAGFGFVNGYGLPDGQLDGVRNVPGFSGAAFAVRAKTFHALGGFDEGYFLYLEDTDLSWRAVRCGVGIVAVSASRIRHDYALEVTAAKFEHLERGRYRLLRTHLRGRDWLYYLPAIVLAEAFTWLWALSKGWAGIRAKAAGLRHGWRGTKLVQPPCPKVPPKRIASWRIPFSRITSNRLVRGLGWLLNLAFRLNTVAWPSRRSGELS